MEDIKETYYVQSIQDLLACETGEDSSLELTDEQALSVMSKNLFKYTNCGAFIEVAEKIPQGKIRKIAIGSIVEGSEAQTETYEFTFPFELQEYRDALAEIEREAKELWDEVNLDSDEDINESLK